MFQHITEAPPDPILGTTTAFKNDPATMKINLGVGAYRTAEGKPYVLPIVQKAEQEALDTQAKGGIDKEYSTIDGPDPLKAQTQKLLFGEDCAAIKEGRIASIQALSGTGSLRVCAEFIVTHLPKAAQTVYMSDPTWGNHPAIFQKANCTVKTYPYWKAETKSLDFDGMLAGLKAAPAGSQVLLHSCAHNPTGIDPTEAQWQQIADVVQERQLVAILDSAYQGYASGDLDKDAYSIRLFLSRGIEFFVCQSFAKNLGLYGERIGMLHAVCKDKDNADRVLSQMKLVVRPMYSSPPIHGAHLVMNILGVPQNYAQWKKELKEMADRILEVRGLLRSGLEQKGTPGKWNHITDQIGMFSYTGLSEKACEALTQDHHIYLLKSGRISLAGLNKGNVQYMVDAVHSVLSGSKL